jgi:hypothetical protein
MQQMEDQQGGKASSGRQREGDSSVSSDNGQEGGKYDSSSLLEPWAEKP